MVQCLNNLTSFISSWKANPQRCHHLFFISVQGLMHHHMAYGNLERWPSQSQSTGAEQTCRQRFSYYNPGFDSPPDAGFLGSYEGWNYLLSPFLDPTHYSGFFLLKKHHPKLCKFYALSPTRCDSAPTPYWLKTGSHFLPCQPQEPQTQGGCHKLETGSKRPLLLVYHYLSSHAVSSLFW